ncbi:MAG: hypothetical protein ACRDYB_15340, partial [Acidimicrobiales bacterium]
APLQPHPPNHEGDAMGAPEHASDAEVTDAVTALPGATAAEVAGALGIGRSTAAKHLARLEAAGAVERHPGGRSGGARVADRWFPATPADPTTPPGEPSPEAPETAASHDSTPPAPGGAGDCEPKGPGPAPESPSRLAPGVLGAMVRDYLASRPGVALGPSGIAKALGRSAGAVSNALIAMAATGEIVQVQDRPRRYRTR